MPIDIVIFDTKYAENEIKSFIKNAIANISQEHHVVTLDTKMDENDYKDEDEDEDEVCNHVVIGGTFDRLHAAHKLLLSEAILRARKKLTVGVTEENMTHNKLLWELIEDVDLRVNNVLSFVKDICIELEYDICKISDPYGPSIIDSTMKLIIVSEETFIGAKKINQIRIDKGLEELKIVSVPLIDHPNQQFKEENKISSSTIRLRLLGTLLKPVQKLHFPGKPYVIGLTGGIASGKSHVAAHLKQLGASVINADKIGHKIYENGKPCYERLIEEFGNQIINQQGVIDRKILGGIVFKCKNELQKLNNIVWPAMGEEIQNLIKQSTDDIVCIEAAVLSQAGWDNFCNEIWTTIIPPDEAIKRLLIRDNLTQEQAQNRLESQPLNREYIKNAHIVICPFWEVNYTEMQVKRAWKLLQCRLAV